MARNGLRNYLTFNPMDDILDHLLHTQGYLPPRNEEEFDEFEKEFSKVKVKKIQIDTNKISKQ